MKPTVAREDSVSRVVRESLGIRPCILEALRMGVVNYSALARMLQSDVERRLGRKVTLSAIKMAVTRLAKEEEGRKAIIERRLVSVISKSSLTLVDDIAVVTLWEKEALKIMPKIFRAAEKARFFQMTQGVGHVTLILDTVTFQALARDIPKEAIETIIENQSAVVLTSPREIIETPGVLSYLTTLLASEGINITQVISCHTDSIFVVDKSDSLKAYTALIELIERFRHACLERACGTRPK